ncbi:MAG TPA: alkaline phosphatase family protein [Actinomycetota bacterium]|nr:alkaline phosphatase family protein [Actinomycetota bacterium]
MSRRPRRVVYVIVDGMSTTAFEQVTASGRAPALAFLKQHSGYVRDSVAIFPTITPCATASLVTGAMPDEHGIPGMCWYDRDARRFVNYGQSPRAAVVKGMNQIVEDFLVNLNTHHLSKKVSTIHEKLEGMGLVTASINFMVFRGPHVHELKPNIIERLLFHKRLPDELHGPKEHYFADIVTGSAEACTKLISARGLEKRVRATDAWASCVTRELVEKDAADMILFYLHENDHASHRDGPDAQLDSLADADRHVANVLDAFDSWERAIEEVGFVVTADHSQSPIADDDDHVFALEDVLDDFEQVDPSRGDDPFDGADVATAGNGRLGFVYLNEARARDLLGPVCKTLVEHPGVDQVMWRDDGGYVVDSERGRVRFEQADDGVVDERGNAWTFEGDLDAVSGIVEDGRIRTPEYPLALWRVKHALDLDRVGDVVVTTKLCYEVKDLAGGDHRGGGDHGSLHAQDSLIPFMSTLADPPLRPATVDVCPHVVGHFRAAAP